ncbi:hypothetical protein FF1_022263 [Malus domestica]
MGDSNLPRFRKKPKAEFQTDNLRSFSGPYPATTWCKKGGRNLINICLWMDKSSMTGESEHVEVNGGQNPFLYSRTKVVDGYGQMLVALVGMNSTWGEMMSLVIRDTSDWQTP